MKLTFEDKTNNDAVNIFCGATFIISIAVMCSYTIIQLSLTYEWLSLDVFIRVMLLMSTDI